MQFITYTFVSCSFPQGRSYLHFGCGRLYLVYTRKLQAISTRGWMRYRIDKDSAVPFIHTGIRPIMQLCSKIQTVPCKLEKSFKFECDSKLSGSISTEHYFLNLKFRKRQVPEFRAWQHSRPILQSILEETNSAVLNIHWFKYFNAVFISYSQNTSRDIIDGF